MEKLTKICCTCKKDLPATDEFFASRYDRKKKEFQNKCRLCQKIYRKAHYEKNKDKYVKKAAEWKRGLTSWYQNLKKDYKCQKCGENRSWVLDFHHRDPAEKEMPVSVIVFKRGSKKAILDEIEKCDALCANCHRDLHYKEKMQD